MVKAQILAFDPEKRLIRLSMKQLVPTGLDEYLAEHKEGDIVTGRMIEVSEASARVELGEGSPGNVPDSRKSAQRSGERRRGAAITFIVKARSVVVRFHAAGTLEERRGRGRDQAGSHAGRSDPQV